MAVPLPAGLTADQIERRPLRPDEIFTDSRLDRLLSYWHSLRPIGGLPDRRAFDVFHARDLMGRINIVDVTAEDPLDFRFRLYGTGYLVDGGRDYTGKALRDSRFPLHAAAAAQDYSNVKQFGLPARHLVTARLGDIRYEYERVLLPFAADRRTVDTVLACSTIRPRLSGG